MNYTFYYKPRLDLINQNVKDFEYMGFSYYKYFKFGFSIYSPSKTKLPALYVEFIFFGCGFQFHTHWKK